ncbi:response regulator [Pendulispora albinea]|uniref:Response regulator n=1 Tax=Pendulispora albinea TaxID=2741071 RepID=A0ABZ2LTG8_9BACT
MRKVVASILERHGYIARTAPDGESALAALANGAQDTELVLVDFVMPRMNGLAFCRELRKRFPDRKVGVVLMSAKADRIRESFLQQAGALDAITKPFDPQALLLVIDNVLRKVDHAPEPGPVAEGELAPQSALRPPSDPPEDASLVRARAVATLSMNVARELTPIVGTLVPEARHEHIFTHLSRNLSEPTLRTLGRVIRDVDLGEGKLVLSGDLSSLPIGAVLQMLQMENQTGVLVVEGEDRTIVMTLREGLIDLVQSRGAGDEFRLGRYFVEAGLVTPEELEALSATRAKAGSTKLLGDTLVESNKISLADLRNALIRQSSELVYEALRWQKGHFEFRRRPPPTLAAASRLGLPAAQVVMEGFRRVDEWRLIEARVGRFDEVLVRDPVAIEALGEGRLVKSERSILDSVDGRRTIREIVSAAHMSSFEGCRILFQLIEARLVRRRPT